MPQLMKEGGHLVRIAVLFLVGFGLFLVLRAVAVPKDFGVFGHYRAGALPENMERSPAFAGRQACAGCHDERVTELAAGKHATISCENCHGPLASHAADPTAKAATKPDFKGLCERCHAANVARPKGHPQVEPEAHSQGSPCHDCHSPHAPSV